MASASNLFVISEETGKILARYLSDGVDPETETKKKFISRINQLESALLGAQAFTPEEQKTIEERKPDTFSSMTIDELKALGLSLGAKVKEMGLVVD